MEAKAIPKKIRRDLNKPLYISRMASGRYRVLRTSRRGKGDTVTFGSFATVAEAVSARDYWLETGLKVGEVPTPDSTAAELVARLSAAVEADAADELWDILERQQKLYDQCSNCRT